MEIFSQSVGKNSERPDISGINEKGHEILIIEAKFWASLTENQPVEYIKRLKDNSILLFICPKLRINSLNNEIERKILENGLTYKYIDKKYILDENKQIYITDWYTILELLKTHLTKNHEMLLVSDIDQLIGFCEIIDNYSFLPIIDKDLSPSIPKKINSYCDLLDKVIDKLKSDDNVNTDGLKATGQKYGYNRYVNVGDYGVSLEINFKMWEMVSDTPFWFTVLSYRKGPWRQSSELKNKLKEISLKTKLKLFQNISENLSFALFPILNHVEDRVIEDIVEKINIIMEELE